MRILMLGWEFPPFIAGGLGTACHGLTKALDRQGHEVIFLLPRAIDNGESHVELRSPASLKNMPPRPAEQPAPRRPDGSIIGELRSASLTEASEDTAGFERTKFVSIPASFSSPYAPFDQGPGGQPGEGLPTDFLEEAAGSEGFGAIWRGESEAFDPETLERMTTGGGSYGGDLMGDSQRYARLAVALARYERFDVIHAHDWLTYPAGLALRAVSGKPLVVQMHATEFDRSGQNVNQQVYDIERAGIHGADRVIAVSQLTKNILVNRYSGDASKIDVVYNGVEGNANPQPGARIEAQDRIVLFLGRITMQKGPEYFIQSAKRVLEKVPDAKFVVAGSGDMAIRMIEMAAAIGIGHKVLFTGFLRGRDVERIFSMADCYVMPSVSEPFGIAALEAMLHDTPVIISKQSGAAEVLTHALKVDFWDTDEMASKIVSVLRYPALSSTLREHGAYELRGLTWDGAAEKCVKTYHRAALNGAG
ncbi:MAG: glycosyltransferase [Planctomycetota bacterium]